MQDRGTHSQSLVIYSESFDVEGTEHVKRRGLVEYSMYVEVHAYETGDAQFRDNRACHFDNIIRKLTRNILIKDPDGSSRNVGEKIIVVPNADSRKWDDPCNDHIPYDLTSHIASLLGNKETWSNYISEDLPQVISILELFGKITERRQLS